MTRPIKNLWLFLLSLLGLYGGAASAASTAVLCNPDIKGDSQLSYAPGCIDVLAWSWGLSSQKVTGTKGTQLGPSTFSDFTFTKQIDSSSDNLFRFAADHKVPISGIVEFREYQDCNVGCPSPQPYLTIHMRPVQVTSESMGNSSGGDLDTESITLVFDQISYCYAPQGTGTPQCFAYDGFNKVSIPPF